MNSLQKVPAWFWMLLSYAALAVPFLWAASQPATTVSTSVFIACLLVCWIPAFVYVNREDIQEHRVFWISQSVSLLVTAIVFGALTWLSITFQDRNAYDARQTGSPLVLIATVIAYLIAHGVCSTFASQTRAAVEASLEKKLSPPARQRRMHQP